jgi:hypothetical protein
MIRWTTTRDNQNEVRTYGTLLRPDGSRFSDTIERPWLNNAPDISCIPAGLYTLKYQWSDGHEMGLFWFLNVPGRTACEFHSANLAAQLKGCMAPGDSRASMMAIQGYAPADGVTNSRATLGRFMAECGIPDFLSHTTPESVAAFVAAHSDLSTIEMGITDPPTAALA